MRSAELEGRESRRTLCMHLSAYLSVENEKSNEILQLQMPGKAAEDKKKNNHKVEEGKTNIGVYLRDCLISVGTGGGGRGHLV